MGMAASQARFLGLTARKSNVEYQGQQINQQRTALATESSNLFHQMMTLDVPTPPVSTDFYKTKYTLQDSELGNNSAYTIVGMTKNNNGSANYYDVKLSTIETSTVGSMRDSRFTRVAREEKQNPNDENSKYYSYTTTINSEYVTYDEHNCTAYKKDVSDENKNVLAITKDTIYKVDETTANLLSGDESTKTGYDAVKDALEDADKNKQLYFYQDASGKNCFLTEDQLTRITSEAFSPDCSYNSTCNDDGTIANIGAGVIMQMYYPRTKESEITTQVQAVLESSSSGRYTNIKIDKNDKYPSNLSNAEFSIICTNEYDEQGYKDAYSDYEFKKNLYEQRIADINSQTEIIQAEDKQLELRLQQLDTEQESISTEMDSVTKVIEDNIQKTFDAFG